MRNFVIAVTSAAGLLSAAALAQEPSRSIPDFSAYGPIHTFPASNRRHRPGPVLNKSRVRGGPYNGVSDFRQFVGDHNNPILKPRWQKS
jgi:hypothetical protein